MNSRACLAVTVTVAALVGVSCGSSTPAQPTVVATPAPVQSATAPVATLPPATLPSPSPSPSAPTCTQGLCEAPTTNTNPAVRLTIRLYKIVLPNGRTMQGVTNDTVIPVGSEATIDATAKDEFNNDTLGTGHVDFWVENNGTVKVAGNHDYQKKLTVLTSGTVDVEAHMDVIKSNTLTLKLGSN